MTAIEITALIILAAFYSSFFIKMILMKRRGISSNLLGKGQKSDRALIVERMLKAVTYSGACLQFASVFIAGKVWEPPVWGSLRIIGLLLAAAGTAFFITAMAAMKNNWRSGCDKHQNTSLVVSGPYKISRNPAFVGFDLLYIGCALALPNIINLLFSVLAVAVFHLQTLEEERFLENTFGDEYRLYQSQVNRYFGRSTR